MLLLLLLLLLLRLWACVCARSTNVCNTLTHTHDPLIEIDVHIKIIVDSAMCGNVVGCCVSICCWLQTQTEVYCTQYTHRAYIHPTGLDVKITWQWHDHKFLVKFGWLAGWLVGWFIHHLIRTLSIACPSECNALIIGNVYCSCACMSVCVDLELFNWKITEYLLQESNVRHCCIVYCC